MYIYSYIFLASSSSSSSSSSSLFLRLLALLLPQLHHFVVPSLCSSLPGRGCATACRPVIALIRTIFTTAITAHAAAAAATFHISARGSGQHLSLFPVRLSRVRTIEAVLAQLVAFTYLRSHPALQHIERHFIRRPPLVGNHRFHALNRTLAIIRHSEKAKHEIEIFPGGRNPVLIHLPHHRNHGAKIEAVLTVRAAFFGREQSGKGGGGMC
mmetsp:Transcript_41284/g.66422  ORF Transcript_41284/g.66422 Transcript_41284/m.66422 type:complete len:212 (-) Transcript_41284:117-752(-)